MRANSINKIPVTRYGDMKMESGKVTCCLTTVLYAGESDRGRKRSHNEDSFALLPDELFFCLADGVGGLDAGEVASQKAVHCIRNHVTKHRKTGFARALRQFFLVRKNRKPIKILKAVDNANNDVYTLAESFRIKMATTLVTLQLCERETIVSHVGDSRAYLLRNNIIGQITIDHTVCMGLLRAGITYNSQRSEINQHAITRALGYRQQVKPDVQRIDNQPDDIFLLCSDGLTDMLDDTTICDTLTWHQANVDKAVLQLIERANVAGGNDNITVIVIKIEK